MSQPGWYPNPDGRGQPRYWDGAQWLDEQPRRSSSVGWVIGGLVLIATLVVIMVLLPGSSVFGNAAPAVEDTRSDRPTAKPWDERPLETDEPDDEGEGGSSPVECADTGMPFSEVAPDGRMHGGGVSLVAPTGPQWMDSTTWMPWMSEQNSRVRSVADGWVASVDVGAVRNEDGFTSPKQAARAMLTCMASSWMYQGYTGDEVLVDEPFALDGSSGWYIKANVYVDRADGIKGDVLDIHVLDLGRDGELSVIVGCATIADDGSISEVTQALATMQVD